MKSEESDGLSLDDAMSHPRELSRRKALTLLGGGALALQAACSQDSPKVDSAAEPTTWVELRPGDPPDGEPPQQRDIDRHDCDHLDPADFQCAIDPADARRQPGTVTRSQEAGQLNRRRLAGSRIRGDGGS